MTSETKNVGFELSKRAESQFLYHYAPVEARDDILSEGLKTPYSLMKDKKAKESFLDKYRERTAETLDKPEAKVTPNDVLKGLEMRREFMFDGEGGSRALSAFFKPIPDLEGMKKELKEFAEVHDLYRMDYKKALKDRVVQKAAIVEEKTRSERPVEPKDLYSELSNSKIKPAQWKEKGKFYFSGKAHAMMVLKDGILPPKYLELIHEGTGKHVHASRKDAIVAALMKDKETIEKLASEEHARPEKCPSSDTNPSSDPSRDRAPSSKRPPDAK